VLRDHPNELVRDAYLMKLADHCRVDHEQLRSQLRGGRRAASPVTVDASRGDEHPSSEVEALVLLVHRRDDMLPWLDDCLFVDDRHLAVSRALAAEPDVAAALAALRDTDPGAAELLARVAVSDSDAEPDDVGALLIDLAARRRLRELEAEARVAVDPLTLSEPIRDLRLGVERLHDRLTRHEAAVDLLAALAAPVSG
jgi:hypothetical protein